IAAANTRSKNNSVQLGRRMCRSCSGQISGRLKSRVIIARTAPVAASLCEANCKRGRPLADRAAHRTAATVSVFDRGSSGRSSDLGNVLILLWRVTADSDGADDFPFEKNGNATLQRCRTRQRERSYATLADLIFKHFARPAENRCRPGLRDPDLDA